MRGVCMGVVVSVCMYVCVFLCVFMCVSVHLWQSCVCLCFITSCPTKKQDKLESNKYQTVFDAFLTAAVNKQLFICWCNKHWRVTLRQTYETTKVTRLRVSIFLVFISGSKVQTLPPPPPESIHARGFTFLPNVGCEWTEICQTSFYAS